MRQTGTYLDGAAERIINDYWNTDGALVLSDD